MPSFTSRTKGRDMSIREIVKEKYGQAALRVVSGSRGACCGSAPSSCCSTDPITSNLYDVGEKSQLPESAVLASLGCGNPTALAELKPGETVLDLGSGGGIDVLLSAKRVGPTGKAYGLDIPTRLLPSPMRTKRRQALRTSSSSEARWRTYRFLTTRWTSLFPTA